MKLTAILLHHRYWLIGILLLLSFTTHLISAQPNCSSHQLIDRTLPNGARWQLCWHQKNDEGIVLQDIYYTTASGVQRKILKQVNLAQVYVALDDNSGRFHQLTDYGFGGNNLQDLWPEECPNGTLIQDNNKNILCSTVSRRGYIYKYYSDQRQGYQLDLFSISQTSDYTWVVRWRFFDDGTIEPAIGASGQLQHFGNDDNYGSELDADGAIGIASALRYSWRLDFDIAGNGANDAVEELAVTPTDNGSRKQLSITQLSTETGRSVDTQLKRSWRVRDTVVTNNDAHAISYHLEPLHTGYHYNGASDEAWAEHDFYVTHHNSCEKFITNNPTQSNCGSTVTDFVDGENISSADLVIWYSMTYHHLPRDEDELYMPLRWSRFQLVPPRLDGTKSVSFFARIIAQG